jgi:segregation and condensation protein B
MEEYMTEEQQDCGLPIADCGLNPEDEGQTTENDQTEDESASEDLSNPKSQIPNPPSEVPTIESVIEAVLFASDEPLTDSRLASIVETTAKQARECIEALNEKYRENHNAFRIEPIAGGYQMLTMSIYNNWLKKMLRARSDSKLSPAAMETLAIIAYKQPVIRADVEAIRGVAVGEVIRSLMYKGLVKIVGRAEILGRPMLYGTTKRFLEVFGLNSLKDLPKAEELKKPD